MSVRCAELSGMEYSRYLDCLADDFARLRASSRQVPPLRRREGSGGAGVPAVCSAAMITSSLFRLGVRSANGEC
ncbi:Protein of unknown function [Micromonospora lupini str. Lupac 08]|uniref:Uncharacterized protein n=1 Tax=Micromonospora lupini str. Lupac 08 TaxID=1150864 RepID=I0L636_9ACTN|nr:Protein of unknown function [Micromonospora lupini str. Lupac 08]